MDPKKVMFVNRVYPPVPGATGLMLEELVLCLHRRGWTVSVVAAAGYEAPAGVSLQDGITVHRVPSMAFTRASLWRRALSYLSLYPALLRSARKLASQQSAIVTLTDPPLLLTLSGRLRAAPSTRMIHWAQDLYPEVAEELNVLRKGGVFAGFLRMLSTRALLRQDVVVAVGRCMVDRLRARRIPAERIAMIPNWGLGSGTPSTGTNGTAVDDNLEARAFRRSSGWAGKFVAMYSGNFGLAHPFDGIIDAARRLEKKCPGILFAFVGEGPSLAALKKSLRGLDNVAWLPPQPLRMLPASLRAADVHLACMQESALGLVVPSKVYGILAAGRPCLFLGPGKSEVARLILEFKCGAVMRSDEGGQLAETLVELATASDTLAAMRENATSLAPRLGVAAAADAFEGVLLQQGRDSSRPHPNPSEAGGVGRVEKWTISR